jgi:transketolase
VSTFGKFVARGYDQLEMGFIGRFNLKIVASHTGISLRANGPSQMALPDLAFFRAWTTVRNHAGQPFPYLLQPSDAHGAYALTLAIAEHNGPCYMRTMRPDVPLLYDDSTLFSLGGHHVLAEGHDLLLVASGYMVHEGQRALAALQEHGIEATLVDLYSIPFDGDAIVNLAQESHGRVLTLEDNYGGGFGSAVADVLVEYDCEKRRRHIGDRAEVARREGRRNALTFRKKAMATLTEQFRAVYGRVGLSVTELGRQVIKAVQHDDCLPPDSEGYHGT